MLTLRQIISPLATEFPHEENDRILASIRSRDRKMLKALYGRYYPSHRRWLSQRGCDLATTEDLFQEAIIVIFRKLDDPAFKLEIGFEAYLRGVVRFIWYNHARKKNKQAEVTMDELPTPINYSELQNELIAQEKRQLFQEKLTQLGNDCQRVLRWFFAGESLATIASRLGYSYDYAKKKNRLCKNKLADLVRNDPRYRELNED